jgi:hypothetical protein
MCSASQPEVVGAVPKAPVQDQLVTAFHFPVAVYTIEKPEFLSTATEVSNKFLEKAKNERPLDEIYPAYMTDNLLQDERMIPFAEYVSATAWNILVGQGHAMNNFQTVFTELWCQEHHKHSAMEQHVHGYGAQIVGFYFLDVPENSSKVVFHDPKAAKVQTVLPEVNPTQATYASNMINFEPKPGMLMFTNAWLAHSFSRHAADEPMRFIHFNLAVQMNPQQACPMAAEVV